MRSCCPYGKKILILNGVDLRRRDTDIENGKRIARRMPRPSDCEKT